MLLQVHRAITSITISLHLSKNVFTLLISIFNSSSSQLLKRFSIPILTLLYLRTLLAIRLPRNRQPLYFHLFVRLFIYASIYLSTHHSYI